MSVLYTCILSLSRASYVIHGGGGEVNKDFQQIFPTSFFIKSPFHLFWVFLSSPFRQKMEILRQLWPLRTFLILHEIKP